MTTKNYTSSSTMRFARADDDNEFSHSRPSSVSGKTRHGTVASGRGASIAAYAGIGTSAGHKHVTFDLLSPARRTGSSSARKSGSNESVGKYSAASANCEQHVTAGNEAVVEDPSWCTLVRRYDSVEDRAHANHASVASLRNAQVGGMQSTMIPASAKPSCYSGSVTDGAVTSRFVETHGTAYGRGGAALGVMRGRGTTALRSVTHYLPASSFSDADAAFGELEDDTSDQKEADSFDFVRPTSLARGNVRGRAAAATFSPRGNRGATLGRTVSNYPEYSAAASLRHAASREDTESRDDQYDVDAFGVGKTTSQAVGPVRGRGVGPRGRGGPTVGRTVNQPRICSDDPALDFTRPSSGSSASAPQSGTHDTFSTGTSQGDDDENNINPTSSTAIGERDGFRCRDVGALSMRGSSYGLSSRGFGTRHLQSPFGAAATETTKRDSGPPAGRPGGPLHGTAESGSRLRNFSRDNAEQRHEDSSIQIRDASSTSRQQAVGDHSACHLCRHVQPSIGHLIVERAFFIIALLVVAGAFLLLFFVTASDCPTKLNGQRY